MGQAVEVELESLQALYDHLWKVEGVLSAARKSLESGAMDAGIGQIVDGIDGMFGETGLPGINAATTAAANSITGESVGLNKTLQGMHQVVVKNLQAVYDTYNAYLAADQNGASGLTSAGNTALDKSWQDATIPPDLAKILREIGFGIGFI